MEVWCVCFIERKKIVKKREEKVYETQTKQKSIKKDVVINSCNNNDSNRHEFGHDVGVYLCSIKSRKNRR